MATDWKPEIGGTAWFFETKVDWSGKNYTCLMEGEVYRIEFPDLVFLKDDEDEGYTQFLTTVYESPEAAINDLPVKYLGGCEQKTRWIDGN